MGDTVGYLIQALVLAKSIRNTKTDCDILLLYLPYDADSVNRFSGGPKQAMSARIRNNRVKSDRFLEQNSTLLDELNIQLVRLKEKPYDASFIQNPDYREILNNNPSCALDFHKISCWNYGQYSKVLFLDADILVRKNLNHLFELDHDFMYCDGVASPVNSGVFCLKPDSAIFEDLRQTIHKGNFSYEEGWNSLGREHKNFNAIEVCQGLFYYHFIKGIKQFKTHKLPRNIYNNAGPYDIFCENKVPKERYLKQLTSFDDVCIVHFTSWGRLYRKGNESTWDGPDFGQIKIAGKVRDELKVPFHEEWVDTFSRLEIKGD